MIFLAVSERGREFLSEYEPKYDGCEWLDSYECFMECQCFDMSTTIELPKGTIAKILGRELTFQESPVKIN